MVAVDEADGFGLGAGFEDLGGALEFEVFDHGDDVAVGEDVAVGIFDDARGFGGVGEGPLVAAGEAFAVVGSGEEIGHLAEGAGGAGHGKGGFGREGGLRV